MRGESGVDHRWLHRGTRISAIAAMSACGILAVKLMSGSVNGDKSFDYVRGSFISEMLPFDGENPKSICVVDNCSIHHVRHVTQLFKDAGILLFLPPYSPDFMLIENTFSFVKHYLSTNENVWLEHYIVATLYYKINDSCLSNCWSIEKVDAVLYQASTKKTLGKTVQKIASAWSLKMYHSLHWIW